MKVALKSALPEAPFAEREQLALELSNVALRETLEEDLQAIADEFGESVLVDGIEYAKHLLGTVDYHSLVGPLDISRATYREVGVRNGPTVVPMSELRAADAPPKKSVRKKPRIRRTPLPIDVNFRMAYVGVRTDSGAH